MFLQILINLPHFKVHLLVSVLLAHRVTQLLLTRVVLAPDLGQFFLGRKVLLTQLLEFALKLCDSLVLHSPLLTECLFLCEFLLL
jgi:hypothetical protein